MGKRKPKRIKQSKPITRFPTPAELIRFLEKIEVGEVPKVKGIKTPCWNFIAHRDPDGYGQFWFDGQAHWAPRFSHQAFKYVRMMAGNEGDHLCHNPACVNPAHLAEKTKSENSAEPRRREKANGHPGNGRKCYTPPDDDVPF